MRGAGRGGPGAGVAPDRLRAAPGRARLSALPFALAACALLVCGRAGAAGGEKIAVLEFELARGVRLDRIYFSDKVRSLTRKLAPGLFVMTRESTEMLLAAFGKGLDCAEGKCEVELGKALGADYVISGRITKVGSRLAMTLRLHKTGDGQLVGSEEAMGRDADALVDASDAAVRALLAGFAPAPVVGPALATGVAPATPAATPAAPARPLPARVAPGSARVEPKSGLSFVAIPEGAFRYQGERAVPVEAFELGATEVTVGAYARCVKAGACSEPRSGGGCNWGTDRADHPVNCVDWRQAHAFCKWIGGRLPTAREWEYVASGGGEGRTYPWGDQEPDEQRARWQSQGTAPVGAHPAGDSRWGLHDMAGNVAEWTASDNADGKEVRGGGWQVPPQLLRAAARGASGAKRWLDDLGVRCAR